MDQDLKELLEKIGEDIEYVKVKVNRIERTVDKIYSNV